MNTQCRAAAPSVSLREVAVAMPIVILARAVISALRERLANPTDGHAPATQMA